ncbi:MAG: hypothetical protein P8P29_02855 [Flavobacteriaceae bacterium]|nr:hypothetical protein [Flavobacteriaceae bacterium]
MNTAFKILIVFFLSLGIISFLIVLYHDNLVFNFNSQGWSNFLLIFDFSIKSFSIALGLFSVFLVLKKMDISYLQLKNSTDQLKNTTKNNLSNNSINLIYKSVDKIESILDQEEPKTGIILNIEHDISQYRKELENANLEEHTVHHLKKVIESLGNLHNYINKTVANDKITNRILLTLIVKFLPEGVNSAISPWTTFFLKRLTLQFKILTYNLAMLDEQKSGLESINKFICTDYLLYLLKLKKLGMKIEDSAITYFYHWINCKASYPYDITSIIDSDTLKVYEKELNEKIKSV